MLVKGATGGQHPSPRPCSPLGIAITLQWHHNEHNGISNHRRLHCLLNCLFRHRSKKTSKLRLTCLCVGNSTVTGDFPAQRASNAETAYIWWSHHGTPLVLCKWQAIIYTNTHCHQFSAANLALAGFPLTNALGENLPSRYVNMFNLRLCNAVAIHHSLLKFGHMHLCGKGYKYLSLHYCKCNSFGCIAAIRYGNACPGPHCYSVYSGSEHRKFNSPRLVKREAGFPNPRRALIGSNQRWRFNDSPYYREYAS